MIPMLDVLSLGSIFYSMSASVRRSVRLELSHAYQADMVVVIETRLNEFMPDMIFHSATWETLNDL